MMWSTASSPPSLHHASGHKGVGAHYNTDPENPSSASTGEFAMPLVKAYDEVENPRIERELPNGHFAWRTDFIKRPDPATTDDTPMAFLAEGSAHRLLRTHF